MLAPFTRWAGALLACLLLSGPLAAPALARDTLTIGSISDDPERERELFAPLAAYVGEHLGAGTLRGVEVVVASSAEEMAAGLADGTIDVYIDSPFIVAQIARQTGAKPFLRRWKKGMAEYHTLFVTRRDSGIETLDDLRGRVVAFDEPHSSSGYLLPKALLLERGYHVVEMVDADAPPAGAIAYVFTGDDANALFRVVKGRAAAAATSPDFYEQFARNKGNELRVLARSISVPRHVMAHRADLDPAVARDLERILTGMEATEEGRAALRAFENTTRFDHFPGGVEATFAPIHAMLDRLEAVRR